jgi:uncharacterized protein (DUF169 family)
MVEYEDRLKLKGHDFSILDKFEFKYTPVGFKFFNDASDHKGLELEKLDKKIAWCQMLREAQNGRAFYFMVKARSFRPGQDYPAAPEDNYPV